ncbi:hypothetical protein WJX79_004065 [Trebouxia sp. C0005]
MSQVRHAACWLLLYAFPSLVISLGSPEIAPAISLQSVFEAPEVVDRVSDSYTLDAFVWRDAQPLVVTGSQPVSSSQTRLSDAASPIMATLYLNDEACNRQTAPVITCDAAWVVQTQGSQPEVWMSAFTAGSATIRGGPGWQLGSNVEVVLEASDAEGTFFISTNTTIQSTE